MTRIPKHLRNVLIPNPNLTVESFLSFKLPSSTPIAIPKFNRPEKFLSVREPNVTAQSPEISTIPSIPVPSREFLGLLKAAIQPGSSHDVRSVQSPYTPDHHTRYPLWVITYWDEVTPIQLVHDQWETAIATLREQIKTRRGQDCSLLEESLRMALSLPWGTRVPGFDLSCEMHYLSYFFTTQWLTDDHEALMLDLLQGEVNLSAPQKSLSFPSVFLRTSIVLAFDNPASYAQDKHMAWLRELGNTYSSSRSAVVMITNLNNNHWVAIVLDFSSQIIRYGDSFNQFPSTEALSALKWWTHHHTGKQFDVVMLPTTQQVDGHSCGLLAWNALAHFVLPEKFPLFDASKMGDERLRMFLRIINRPKAKSESDRDDDDPPSGSDYTMGSDTESSSSIDSDLPAGILPTTSYATLPPSTRASSPAQVSTGIPNKPSDDLPPSFPVSNSKKSQRIERTSSIRNALERSLIPGETAPSLLKYFKKATSQEKKESILRDFEELKSKQDNDKWIKEQSVLRVQHAERMKARDRKRNERARKRVREVESGERSPSGRKRKQLELVSEDPEDFKSIAEDSRPAKTLRDKFHDQNKKSCGRKKKKSRHSAKYINWLVPFLFSRIKAAARIAGGPNMGVRLIVKELKRQDYKTFKKISPNTIETWIDRSGSVPRWSDAVLQRAERGYEPGHTNGGRRGIFTRHPEVSKTIQERVVAIRGTGAAITTIGVRGIMVATILRTKPELFDTKLSNGLFFNASDSFVRNWMREVLDWSHRKATRAAHKLPQDWEDQCEKSAFRKAYAIKEEDIQAAGLFVNSDQTQAVFAPGDKMTWAEKGAKQVSLVGADEKRAFTVLVSVAADGTLLPMQAIYAGKTQRSCPSPNSPNYQDLINAGFVFEPSGTATYWSNQKTMQSFVDKILVPHYSRQKARLGLPEDQKTLWTIDIWSVHRSDEFKDWMNATHPTIILDYVPGGCTGVAQPCDVGIQRPFKLSLKQSYHEDIVNEVLAQIDSGTPISSLDSRIETLRNRSTRWLWKAYQTINKPELVQKAFQLCRVRNWDLSFKSLTSYEIRVRLRALKQDDPEFWKQLTNKRLQDSAPPESLPQAEDANEEADGFEDAEVDDSDISLGTVISSILTGSPPKNLVTKESGTFQSPDDAEPVDEEAEEQAAGEVQELGRGKRAKRANRLYTANFWRHNDNDGSDKEDS